MTKITKILHRHKTKLLTLVIIFIGVALTYFFVNKNKEHASEETSSISLPSCEFMKEEVDTYKNYLNANADKISETDKKSLWADIEEIENTSLNVGEFHCLRLFNKFLGQVNKLPYSGEFKPLEVSNCHEAMGSIVLHYPDSINLSEAQKKSIAKTVMAIKDAYNKGDEEACRESKNELDIQYIKFTKNPDLCKSMCSDYQCRNKIWGSWHDPKLEKPCPPTDILLTCEACRKITPELVEHCWNIYRYGEDYQGK